MGVGMYDEDEVARAVYSAVNELAQLNAALAVALPQLCKSLDQIAQAITSEEPAMPDPDLDQRRREMRKKYEEAFKRWVREFGKG